MEFTWNRTKMAAMVSGFCNRTLCNDCSGEVLRDEFSCTSSSPAAARCRKIVSHDFPLTRRIKDQTGTAADRTNVRQILALLHRYGQLALISFLQFMIIYVPVKQPELVHMAWQASLK